MIFFFRPVIFSVESDPAFVADLVLATFAEAEDTQAPQAPEAGAQENRPTSSQQQPQSSQPVVNVDSDRGSVPVHDTHGRLMASGPRRVSVCAAPLTSTANTTMGSRMNRTGTGASKTPVSTNEDQQTATTTDSDGRSTRDSGAPDLESANQTRRSNEGQYNEDTASSAAAEQPTEDSHQPNGDSRPETSNAAGSHQQNGMQGSKDSLGIESGSHIYQSGSPENPEQRSTTPPPSKKVIELLSC